MTYFLNKGKISIRGKRILDMGCGTGYTVFFHAARKQKK